MAHALDYAQPEPKWSAKRGLSWAVCVTSILISLATGAGSIKLAYSLRHSPSTDPIVGPWRYWFIDVQVSEIGSPIAFMFAAALCLVCWSRETGRWISVAALLIGIAGWVGAVCTFP